MQNTRLNTLVEVSLQRLTAWLRNPWRRISMLIISLLFGNFLASAVSTIAGQRAEPDILAAAIVVGVAEVISWLTYANRPRSLKANQPGANQPGANQRSFLTEALNGVKLGLLYGLFVQAFTLGS
jgi:ABC-type thiamin/hydroxymethylpyrimidine transport system permease subunit